MRLELDKQVEETVSDTLTFAVIVAAILTAPLTVAYWMEAENVWVTALDWVVWAVFAVEYAFYMAISRDRWKTTKENWMSVLIIVFSFPLLHEILKSTRLIRLLRPVPLLRQTAVLRQVELFRLSNVRSAGSKAAMDEAKERLGRQHWAIRFIVRFEYYRSRIVTAILKVLPFVKSSTVQDRREEEQSKREEMEREK
ncbi:MAG: ion transporter [Wenzhouxiangella sp.]